MEERNDNKSKRAKTQAQSVYKGVSKAISRKRSGEGENVGVCGELASAGIEEANQKSSDRSSAKSTRPRPKTSGGIVRQLILQTENQLAQKRSDIEFLESQLEQFREMLSDWEAGVSAIEPDAK